MAVDLSQFAQSPDPTPEGRPEPTTRSTDLAQFVTGADPQVQAPAGMEFGLGVQRGVAQTRQMFFGLADLAGAGLGSEALREFAQQNIAREEGRAERLLAEVPSISDIETGEDFFDWAAAKIGEQVPNLLGVVASGGSGAIANTVVRTSLRNAIQRRLTGTARRRLSQQLGADVTETQISQAVARAIADPRTQALIQRGFTAQQSATAGAGAFSVGINTGDIQNELRDAGIDAPTTAAVGGIVAGALDVAPVAVLINRMFPGVDNALAKGFITDIAKTMGVQTALEGGTEAAQELVLLASRAFHDPAFNPLSEKNRERIIEAAAAGALVGGVAGAAGQATVSVARPGKETVVDTTNRLRSYIESKSRIAATRAATTEQEADSAIPGAGELRDAVTAHFNDTVAPVMNRVRVAASESVSRAREALGASSLGVNFERIVSQVESTIQQRVSPAIDEALALMHQQVSAAREAAANMAGPERQAFLAEQLERIRQDITNFVDQRIKPAMDRGEQDFAQEAKTRDYDDPDSFDDPVDPGEVAQPEDLTRVRLGQVRKQLRTGRAAAGGVVSGSLRLRSRGDDAVPYRSREAAERAVEEVRKQFPGVSEEAIDVEQDGDDFFVAIRDIGAAEQIFESLHVVDKLEEARVASRMNPDKARRVRMRAPGATAFTNFDVPSLALAGVNVIERGGTALPENASKRAVRGLDTMIGRLLDMGYEIEGGFQALGNKKISENLSVRQARGRAQFVPEDAPPLERDPGPVFDEGTATEQLGRQAQITETEAAQAAESQRARGARRRTRSEREQELDQWHRNTRRKVRVGLHSVSEEINAAVHDLVTELRSIAGLSNRVLVVDGPGAQALIENEHPAANDLTVAQMDDPVARVLFAGDDVVIYLSNRVLKSQRAQANIFATVAHELGHVVEETHFRQLSPELQAQLREAHEKSGFTARNPNNQARVDGDFQEWMANQFVAWSTRREAPRSAVEKFFARVGDIMTKIWEMVRGKYGLDETYAQFMDGVAAAAAGQQPKNPFTQHFVNEGTAGYKYWGIPKSADFDTDQLSAASAEVKAKILRKLDDYPGLKQAAVRAWDTTMWLHQQLTASLNGSLRALNLPAADTLADIFNRTPGKERQNPTYFNNVQLHTSLFAKRFRTILNNPEFTESAKKRTLAAAIAGDRSDANAAAILDIFEEMYDYMIDAGLPVDKIKDYFPRVWDVEKVEALGPLIEEKLVELGMTAKEAELTRIYMQQADNTVANQDILDDPLNDVPFEGFLKKRLNTLNDPFFHQFQSKDLDRTIERYMHSAVKRAEFNRHLGSDARDEGTWDPRGRLKEILDEAREQGATQEQLDHMVKAVDANLGRHGRDIPVSARQTMAWVATYQNVRLLLFSTLASFPDIVGPAIRSGDFKTAFTSLRNAWSELVDKESNLNDMARTWGIISDSLNQHVLTEHFDNHWFPERARRINEKFFRAVGLERWTNFTRAAALAVGRDAIKRWASAGDNTSLAELGLTVEDVRSWVDRGEATFGSAGFDANSGVDRKVADALVQFVNESVMRPNPSQRPLWASNPAFMLLFHLKSFMYSFHDTIGRRIYHNFQQADTPWQKAYMVAMPAVMMMALTAIGLELRELIQYKLWGRTPRTDRMGGAEYTFELAQRSGIFGVSQLAMDWEGADERGQLPFMAIGGPTINQLNELISKPVSQTGPKAIPVVGQIPPARQLVRDFTPL